MKRKVHHSTVRCLAAAFAAVMALGTPCATARAAYGEEIVTGDEPAPIVVVLETDDGGSTEQGPTPRTTISGCNITYNCEADGLRGSLTASTTQTASEIGFKDLEVQEKVWYGWKTVGQDLEGLTATNTDSLNASYYFASAENDTKYRVKCTFFANVDGYVEEEKVSPTFTFRFP